MATIVFGNGKKVKFNGNPTQQDIDEVATKLGFNEPEKPPKDLSLGDYGSMVVPAVKAIGKQALQANQELGQGIVRGATFGMAGKLTPEQQVQEESIMTESGKAKTDADKYLNPQKVGEVAGSVIPLILSELAAGVATPILAAKYGLGALKIAMTQAGLTMAGYEGAKGAVQGKPPLETTANMAMGAVGGGVLGAGGYGMGQLYGAATKTLPEYIANEYLNTPAAIAQKARRTNQPSLGKEFLDRTKYGIGSGQQEVYNKIGSELENNRMLVKNVIEKADEASLTGTGTYGKGTLGEPVQISPIQQGKGIDLDVVKSKLTPIIKEQTDIGKGGTADSVDDLLRTFAPGEKVVSNKRAFQLLTELDAEVNNAYLKTANNIPPGTEARAALANSLREQLKQQVPEASQLLSRNHFLQKIQTSLLPQVSGVGGGTSAFTTKPGILQTLIGNRVTLGAARGLQSTPFKETAKGVSSISRIGSKIGLSEFLENVRQKGKKQ